MTARDRFRGGLPRLALPRHSLRARLMLWNMAILALLMGVLGLVTRTLVRSLMIASVDRELLRRTQWLATLPPPPPGMAMPHGPPPPAPGPGGRPWERERGPAREGGKAAPFAGQWPFRVLDRQGRVLFPLEETQPYDQAAFHEAMQGQIFLSTIVQEDTPLRVISRRFPERGPTQGVWQEVYPLTEVHRALSGLGRALLALVPLALLFAAMGGALLTQRVLQPVRRMAQAAGRIGAEDLSRRLPVSGKDEFAELGATFNDMLQRLEVAFHAQARLVEQQRRFTADASHELRTPLAVIKANTSLCLEGCPTPEEYRQSLIDIDRAAGSMTRLVMDLLLLARSDAGRLAQDRIPLPIGEVLQHAIASVPRHGGAAVRLHLPEVPPCVVGNEDELVRLFTNLLENALHYTPADGQVTLTAAREGDAVHIAVADTGPGIPAEHLPHLGERFYRVDASRSRAEGGFGLGLSICKSIAAAHGGRLSFESTLGHGTTVHVWLPGAGPE